MDYWVAMLRCLREGEQLLKHEGQSVAQLKVLLCVVGALGNGIDSRWNRSIGLGVLHSILIREKSIVLERVFGYSRFIGAACRSNESLLALARKLLDARKIKKCRRFFCDANICNIFSVEIFILPVVKLTLADFVATGTYAEM